MYFFMEFGKGEKKREEKENKNRSVFDKFDKVCHDLNK